MQDADILSLLPGAIAARIVSAKAEGGIATIVVFGVLSGTLAAAAGDWLGRLL